MLGNKGGWAEGLLKGGEVRRGKALVGATTATIVSLPILAVRRSIHSFIHSSLAAADGGLFWSERSVTDLLFYGLAVWP